MHMHHNRMKSLTSYTSSLAALAASSSVLVNANTASIMLQTAPHHSKPRNHRHLRLRRIQETEATAELSKSNDDQHIRIPVTPISLQLSPISPTTSLAVVDSSGKLNTDQILMDDVLNYISEVGSRTFVQSDEFGERFVDWTIGDMWTSEYIIMPAKAKDVAVAVAESRGINGGDSPFFDRRLTNSVNEEEGTTILTLAQNSTVTLSGVYWDTDPTSDELSAFLVDKLNSEEEREGLMAKLRPLVCSSSSTEVDQCNFDVTVISSDAPTVAEGGIAGGSGSAALEGSDQGGTNNPSGENEGIDSSSGNVAATDPKATINNTASIGDGSSNNNNLPIILGAVFAALAAFILVGFVYARKRRASSNGSSRVREVDGDKAVGPLALANTQDTEDGAEVTVASWAGAYDSIVSPNTNNAINSSNKSSLMTNKESSGDSVAAIASVNSSAVRSSAKAAGAHSKESSGDSVAAAASVHSSMVTSSAKAAGAPEPSSSSKAKKTTNSLSEVNTANAIASAHSSSKVSSSAKAAGIVSAVPSDYNHHHNNNKSTNAATKEIDNILQDMAGDSDSSFVSDSSAATSNANMSMMSGLSGILDPTPLDEHVKMGSHLSKYSTDTASSNNGYLPKALIPPSRTSSGQSLLRPGSIQKQESFEGTYRSRSAMAKLNMKKDILHAEGRTGSGVSAEPNHDNTNGVGGYNHDVKGKRAFSPNKKKYSKSEKKSFRRNKNKNEDKEDDDDVETSRDLILPADFKRSDSVTGSGGSGSDNMSNISEEDSADLV